MGPEVLRKSKGNLMRKQSARLKAVGYVKLKFGGKFWAGDIAGDI